MHLTKAKFLFAAGVLHAAGRRFYYKLTSSAIFSSGPLPADHGYVRFLEDFRGPRAKPQVSFSHCSGQRLTIHSTPRQRSPPVPSCCVWNCIPQFRGPDMH